MVQGGVYGQVWVHTDDLLPVTERLVQGLLQKRKRQETITCSLNPTIPHITPPLIPPNLALVPSWEPLKL